MNPIDVQFNSLNLSKMEPLDKDGKEFKTLQAYAHDTHGATHGHINVKIRHIYRVERYEIYFLDCSCTRYMVQQGPTRKLAGRKAALTKLVMESAFYSGTVLVLPTSLVYSNKACVSLLLKHLSTVTCLERAFTLRM